MEAEQRTALFLAIAANVIWGTTFLASAWTLKTWDPITASFLRFAAASVLLLPFQLKNGVPISKLTSTERRGLFWVGITSYGALYPLQLAGLMYIPTSVSAVIMLTSPLVLVLLASVLLSETLSANKIAGVVLGGAGGVLLLLRDGEQIQSNAALSYQTLGYAATFLAAVSLALSAIFTRRISKSVPIVTITFWPMLLGALLMAPFSLLEKRSIMSSFSLSDKEGRQSILALIFLASIASVLCFIAWNKALSLSEARSLASTMHIKTPVAITLGVLVAGEPLNTTLALSAVLVILGVGLSQR